MGNSIQSSDYLAIPIKNSENETTSGLMEPKKNLKNYNLNIEIQKKESGDIDFKIKYKPKIDVPEMDPDTAIVILMDIFNQKNNLDVKAASEILKSNNKFTGDLNKEKLEKLKEKIAKIAEEAKKKEQQQISSDIGLGFSSAAAVFAFIGALAFTVVTGGLGMPALFGAFVGLTMTVLDVSTRIAKSTNATYLDANNHQQPLDFTLGGMVKRIVEQVAYDAKKNGIDYPVGSTKENREQKLAELIMGLTIFVNISVAIGCIAVSVVSMKSIAKAGEKIVQGIEKSTKNPVEKLLNFFKDNVNKETAQFIGVASNQVEIIAEINNSVSEISSGITGMELAGLTREVKNYENFINNIEYAVKMMISHMASNQDSIKEMMEYSGKLYEDFSETLSGFYQTELRLISYI